MKRYTRLQLRVMLVLDPLTTAVMLATNGGRSSPALDLIVGGLLAVAEVALPMAVGGYVLVFRVLCALAMLGWMHARHDASLEAHEATGAEPASWGSVLVTFLAVLVVRVVLATLAVFAVMAVGVGLLMR